MENKPKVTKLFFSDFFFSTVFLLLFIDILLFVDYIIEKGVPIYVPIVILLLGLIIFILRFLYLKKFFANCIEVDGEITNVHFYRGRGGASFTYTYNCEVFRRHNALFANKRTRRLHEGMYVTILINKDNPKKALIKEAYNI